MTSPTMSGDKAIRTTDKSSYNVHICVWVLRLLFVLLLWLLSTENGHSLQVQRWKEFVQYTISHFNCRFPATLQFSLSICSESKPLGK